MPQNVMRHMLKYGSSSVHEITNKSLFKSIMTGYAVESAVDTFGGVSSTKIDLCFLLIFKAVDSGRNLAFTKLSSIK